MTSAHQKKVFAICDLEEEYVVRLTGYLNQSQVLPYEVLAFTSLKSLVEYAKGHPIEILLISTDAMCDEVKELNAGRIIILSDGEQPDLEMNGTHQKAVCKYQSAGQLAREVMAACQEGPASAARQDTLAGTEVHAVYSPIARCGKTLFALTLGEVLAEEGKTLYLNLEGCSGFETLFGLSYRSDLTDLLTLSLQDESRFFLKLDSAVRSFGSLFYLPPAFFPSDLREITSEEWLSFAGRLAQSLQLQHIVLDIGSEPADVPALLKHCSHIYMPVLPDPVSRAKISQYERSLEALSCRDLLERTVRLYLPKEDVRGGGREMLDSLLYGRMGDFVRNLLREQEESGGLTSSHHPL